MFKNFLKRLPKLLPIGILLEAFVLVLSYFEANGDIRVKGSVVGRIESGGSIRKKGSIAGEVESNGDVRKHGSIIGRIEANGDVRDHGSIVGRAEGMTKEQAAVLFFFDFFDVR